MENKMSLNSYVAESIRDMVCTMIYAWQCYLCPDNEHIPFTTMLPDLEEIKQLAIKRENENMRFRSFLKGQNSSRTDKLVHELYTFWSNKTDCTLCGNCCTKLRPVIIELDIDRLTNALKLSRARFKEKYLMTDNEGDMLFNSLPCLFLCDTKCSVYDFRPNDCRSYPHLHKNNITGRLFGVLENYAICPIVFHVVEDLKKKLNFR